jgi:hypothetical protein
MNRREFFKAALAMVGAGALGATLAPSEDSRLTRIYPMALGRSDIPLRLSAESRRTIDASGNWEWIGYTEKVPVHFAGETVFHRDGSRTVHLQTSGIGDHTHSLSASTHDHSIHIALGRTIDDELHARGWTLS